MRTLKNWSFAIFAVTLGILMGFTGCDIGNGANASPIYDSVIINMPTSRTETISGVTFHSSGAQFTATVIGSNNHLQDVTWTIVEDIEVGTSITNGLLIVDIADHGKTLTIKATSVGNTSKYDTKTIMVVHCLPSDFFNEWQTASAPNIILTGNKFKQGDLDFDLVWQKPVINDTGNQQDVYPTGYKIVIDIGTDHVAYLFLSIDKQKLMWVNANENTASFWEKAEDE